jgi:hypothetical protein
MLAVIVVGGRPGLLFLLAFLLGWWEAEGREMDVCFFL